MKALTETAAAAIAGPPGATPWATSPGRWLKTLAALWREATATYALMGRWRILFPWGGF
jgi:hypothetical protein